MSWPHSRLDLAARLSELEKATELPICETAPEAGPEAKDAEEPKEEAPEASPSPKEDSRVEEYDGWDPITWTEFRDGKEYHYRLKPKAGS